VDALLADEIASIVSRAKKIREKNLDGEFGDVMCV
jgi:hypothetical protein